MITNNIFLKLLQNLNEVHRDSYLNQGLQYSPTFGAYTLKIENPICPTIISALKNRPGIISNITG